MPEGNKEMYGASYIMGQMSQQGEMSDANEASLYCEPLEFDTVIKRNYPLTEAFPSESGSKHVDESVLGKMAEYNPDS